MSMYMYIQSCTYFSENSLRVPHVQCYSVALRACVRVHVYVCVCVCVCGLSLPHSEVVSQQLHDESAVLVRVLLETVEVSDGIVKRLNEFNTM